MFVSHAFHSSLSLRLSNKLEAIQKTCLRVILDVRYIDYTSALEMCSFKTLHERRENRSLSFAIKSSCHRTNKSLFPLNHIQNTHSVRSHERFLVNKARTECYRNSTIPYLQRRLTKYTEKLLEVRRRAQRRTSGRL